MVTDSLTIVGGGPVGFTAALAFARDGIDVTVIESASAPSLSPRACVYLHTLLPDLDELGILDDMKSRGVIDHDGFNMHLTSLNEVLSAPNTVIEGYSPTPFNVHLGQGELCQIIVEHLGRLPNVTILWSTSVVGLEQDADSVSLTLADDRGATRTHRTSWVIGADGGRSAVRGLIGGTLEGMTWNERFIANNIYFDFSTLGFKNSNMYVDPELSAVIARIDDSGLWRCTIQEPDALPEETIEQRVHEYLHALLGPDAEYELDAFQPYRMHQRLSTTMREGRVLLAGDAAHLTNPTGGLGLTTGLYDVFALHEGLGALIDGRTDESVLDRYAAARSKTFSQITSPLASNFKGIVYGGLSPEELREATAQIRESTKDEESQRQMILGLDVVRSPSLLAS
ncbi:hypothetical protein BH11ACT2_BH11ACT2_22360 [soil metagenome]